MIRVYVTVDPETGRALYDDEKLFLGTFMSFQAAYDQLGDQLIRCCSVYSATPSPKIITKESPALKNVGNS
jgi:hypothetical protein